MDEERKTTRHREKKFVLKAFTGHFRIVYPARHHATRQRGKCIPGRDEQIVEYSVLGECLVVLWLSDGWLLANS